MAASVPVMIALKIIGGFFLIYLAVQALRARKSSYDNLDIVESKNNIVSKSTFLKEFITGFMSGILNPKNLLFYLSLFTVVLTPEVGFAFKLGLGNLDDHYCILMGFINYFFAFNSKNTN